MRLRLDGAYALHRFMQFEEQRQNDYAAKLTPAKLRAYQLWSRVTAPLHFALIIIQTVGSQLFRGTTLIVSGVLTLDYHLDGKLVSGLNDYLSVLIQIVVLPLLNIGVIFKPKVVVNYLQQGVNKWDVGRQPIIGRQPIKGIITGLIDQRHRSYRVPCVQMLFVKIPLLIAAIPNMMLDRALYSARSLLRGELKEVGRGFLKMVVPPIQAFCWLYPSQKGLSNLYRANGMLPQFGCSSLQL